MVLQIKSDMPQAEKEKDSVALREVPAGYATASRLLCWLGHVRFNLQYFAYYKKGWMRHRNHFLRAVALREALQEHREAQKNIIVWRMSGRFCIAIHPGHAPIAGRNLSATAYEKPSPRYKNARIGGGECPWKVFDDK